MVETVLRIHVEGANENELRRGAEAAQAFFDDAGVTPLAAAWAYFHLSNELPMTPGEDAIGDLWLGAEEAALKACCAGWNESKIPGLADLELPREYVTPLPQSAPSSGSVNL